MDNQRGGTVRDGDADGRLRPSLLLMPGQLTEVGSRILFPASWICRVSLFSGKLEQTEGVMSAKQPSQSKQIGN